MTRVLGPSEVSETPVVLLSQLAAVLRPQLDNLAQEIIVEIRRGIPEFAQLTENMQLGVGMAISGFVDQLIDPTAPRQRRDDVCRMLGQDEERKRGSLDALQAAYRIGGRVSWRWLMRVGQRNSLSSTTMSLLADMVFGYLDDLASLSLAGYAEARAHSSEAIEERRRQVLHRIIDRETVTDSEFAELATLARWSIPDVVTLVAVHSGTTVLRPLLDEDILFDLGGVEPCLLVPGPWTEARQRNLQDALPGEWLAIGVTVPLHEAVDSLRWARQALRPAVQGVFGRGKVVRCADHLCEIWLLSDTALIDQLGKRQLAVLSDLTSRQRARSLETLGALLLSRGSAVDIAHELRLHPQTVRYRIRQLEKTFGDRLDNPDERFALELVMRAARLRKTTAINP